MSRPAPASGGAAGPGLVVECCGLPGAGKSYVAAALLGGLRRRGGAAIAGDASTSPDVPAIQRIPRKLLAAAGAALDEPGGAVRAGLAIARAECSVADAASRSLQWFATQGALDRAARRGGVHVFQEGLLQALWSIGLRGDPDPLLEALDAGAIRCARPDVLVVVNAPVEVAAARLADRSSTHSRTQALAAGERTAELRRGAELLGCLVEWGRTSIPQGHVVEVANADDGSPDEALAGLVDRLASGLERPGGRRAGIEITRT